MNIIYNPKTGAPIPKFNFNGSVITGADGSDVVLAVGALGQFDAPCAEFMLKNWGFLINVSQQEAQKILEKPKENEFKCQYCDFGTDTKVALSGHMRKHKEDIAKDKEPAIDPTIVPVITGKKFANVRETASVDEKIATEGGSRTDGDGVSWYGPGAVEEPRSQSTIGPVGQKGHFGGGV